MPATALTPAIADALAEAVRRGVPIETATAAAGVSASHYYDWLKVAETGVWRNGSPVEASTLALLTELSEKIARAEAEWEAEHVQAILEDARTVNEKTGQRDWRARAFLLTNHPRTRRRWGQHVQVEQESNHRHLHVVQQLKTMTDEELLALEQQTEQPQLEAPGLDRNGVGS